MKTWLPITLAIVLVFVGLGLTIGGSIWYTRTQLQHECSALSLLTSKPVPKPTNPAANPSRVQNYEFYLALVQWRDADGC